MDWNNISVAWLVGVVLVVEQLLKWIIGYFNKAYQIKKGKEDLNSKVDRHDKELTEMNANMEKIFFILKEQDKQSKKTDCAILRNMIIDKYKVCKEVYDNTGIISALDYENLNEMFDRYFSSGGNHLINKLFSEFQKWSVSLEETEV